MDEDDRNADAGEGSALRVATEGESWRFSLDDLEESDSEREPLTAGSPDAEHVAFVLLGVVVTLAVMSRFLL